MGPGPGGDGGRAEGRAAVTDLRSVLTLFFDLFDREIVALILALPRVYAFLSSSGLLAGTAVPRPARVAITLALAIVPAGINLAYVDQFDRQPATLAIFTAKETALGFVLGYMVGWLFWAVQAAGALIDNQRGSSMASTVDPLQGHETSLLGIAFSQVFITYVFITGGALPIIGLLYRSFVIWPAPRGLPVITDEFAKLALGVMDEAVRFVVVTAGPIVAIMFLAEFALAMVSRFAPQIQVFILAMPIKSALAMFVLVFYFSSLLPYAASQEALFGRYVHRLYTMMSDVGGYPPPPPLSSPGGTP